MKLKKFLPFDKFHLQTGLSESEVLTRLQNSIQPQKNSLSLFPKETKPYIGKVIGRSFEIRRSINYRNSFLPVIKGELIERLNKTRISVSLRPSVFVLIFMAFWLGTIGFVCIGIIVVLIIQFNKINWQEFSPIALIPFVMFIFGYGLLMFGYRVESSKSKRFLLNLLEASEY